MVVLLVPVCWGIVVFDRVFLFVIVGDAVSSEPSGDAGSSVSRLAALDSYETSCTGSLRVLKLISCSVRLISPSWSPVLSVC